VQELRSFLGLLNYYGKFIPNLATTLHPLNTLLQKDRKWNWSKECMDAFHLVKKHLTSVKLLTHYDPTLPLTLVADASAYGVGAVISHVFPDGSEHPIAFASRTLTPSEKNYAQLEKEALSLVFGASPSTPIRSPSHMDSSEKCVKATVHVYENKIKCHKHNFYKQAI